MKLYKSYIEIEDSCIPFYPVHYNRKKTVGKVSIRLLPEVLEYYKNGASLPPEVAERRDKELEARRRIDELLANGPQKNSFVTRSLTLMRHQQLGREIAEIRDKFCFFFDTRTGKTPLSLAIIHDDLQKHPEHKWLVVCPLILIENAWLEDSKKFVPDIKVANCHAATKAKRIKAIESDAQLYITNTESFATYKDYFKDFYGCFVDESSSMKSHKSKQSEALVDFAHSLERFYLLSGSPATNGEYEYYMQLKAIDEYCVPKYVSHFWERYFVDISHSTDYKKLILREDRRDELMTQIKKYAVYVDKEDVLETPGREFIEVPIEMPDELMAHYKLLKNELYMEIGDNKILAETAATKLNKLNQVSSGFIIDTQAIKENAFYDESSRQEVYLLDDFRFKRLIDLLNNECRGEQVLIWANYRKEFELISDLLGDRCRCVYGATDIQAKNEAIRLFKSGAIEYLVANPASADKGLTLTNCHICIYFSLNWSYELYKQSMDRIYGSKLIQPKKCLYYVILAEHTIDNILYNEVLQRKESASYAILNHLKGEYLHD